MRGLLDGGTLDRPIISFKVNTSKLNVCLSTFALASDVSLNLEGAFYSFIHLGLNGDTTL